MNRTAVDVSEAFEDAKEENVLDRYRSGSIVSLPEGHEVWMTGDIHDHRSNFRKLVTAADLGANPKRHLILHELIHGEHINAEGAEDSWKMLLEAAELKLDFPDQVHFLLANHDLAQIHGEGIMKSGLSVCEAFNKAITTDFPGHDAMVQLAITEFLLSLPLAVRCPNGVWMSHSLPSDDQVDGYEYDVFTHSPMTSDDYKRKTGPAYQLIWGRNFSPDGARKFADRLGAKLMITGHQPQEAGSATVGDQVLIIDSSHNQGVFVSFATDEPINLAGLKSRLRKIVSLGATDD